MTLIPLCAFKIARVGTVTPILRGTDDRVPIPTYLQRLKNAKHLASGKAQPALSLVGYPDEAAEAIAFVLNDTPTCDVSRICTEDTRGA